jgi:hypothetical protein
LGSFPAAGGIQNAGTRRDVESEIEGIIVGGGGPTALTAVVVVDLAEQHVLEALPFRRIARRVKIVRLLLPGVGELAPAGLSHHTLLTDPAVDRHHPVDRLLLEIMRPALGGSIPSGAELYDGCE